MNDLISDLCNDSSRNIQAVHSDDLLTYRKEYEEVMNEVDRLCLINDPSSTPFQSRYKARDLLTPLVRKLEAQSVIAKVDKEIDRKVARDLQSKVASIRVKLGSIAYDCEEPHSEDGLNENNELDLSIFHDDDIDEDRYIDKDSDNSNNINSELVGLNVVSRDLLYKDFMPGLTIHPFKYLSVRDITSFDIAREIYLRAIKYIDLAKKYYVLDGFVSDHVSLLMSQSKLYLYLSIFESDRKRKLAMYNKRIELLAPLLTQLNKSVYEAFHKQISYELDSNTDNPIDKSQLFTEEFNICTSMIELLPSKIDRMVRYGETGLSL
eukprot:gene19382-25250_t